MSKLSAKKVEGITLPGKYEDGNGLRLVVKASGSKSWVLRYQFSGKRREMGLGNYPDVSLKDARLKAGDLRKLLTEGKDPLAEMKAKQEKVAAEEERARQEAIQKAQQEEQAKVTFKVVAADYIAAHRAGWKNAKHASQWENTLTTYAYPVIGDLLPVDIETGHILEVLKPIWSTKTETASRVRNRIELILDAAKAINLRQGENPARWRGHLDKLLPKRSKVQTVEHHPALPWADMPDFMAELAKHEGMAFRAMEATILTACRTSEVLRAEWGEIDLNARVWTIPAERMKAGKEHRVPLCEALVKLLEALPQLDNNPHVFPGMKHGKPLSNMAMLMALRRMEREDLTMHGFRSTFRDWAGEGTHHPRDVCEQALAHSLDSSVEAAYRRGDLFEKRRALMEDWARYITQAPVKGENVVAVNFKQTR